MKVVLQRVESASVDVEGRCVGKILRGLLIFVGITQNDTPQEAEWLAQKICHLRLFEDQKGKFNLSLLEVEGQALIVSQFTLYADLTSGRRPSFTQAAPPEIASPLYETFIAEVKKSGVKVATGLFGAKMKVHLINDGPVTLLLEKNPEKR